MKHYYVFFYVFIGLYVDGFSQNFTTYFTGNTTGSNASPLGGVCLMGGATENDIAMLWFLEQANGGDVLVLRASGSDGYNEYMYVDIGGNINSVETIVFHNAQAAFDPYIHERIQQAEAIWFAGGDQWDYISYWRNTPIDSLINEAISTRQIVVGGTSAGMAIQGGFYFSAEQGTVTSSEALMNPYHSNVTVDSSSFINNAYLGDVITDTHYDNPDRRGRHIAFLSRILTDYHQEAKAIACDEYTAVCIDTNGMAKIYGGYPGYDDNAYFIQTNCELSDITPENCSSGSPLDWNLGNEAIKVYKAKGTENGNNSFDLTSWDSGIGGEWEDWYVDNGQLLTISGNAPNCSSLSTVDEPLAQNLVNIYPNPANEYIILENKDQNIQSVVIRNTLGVVQDVNLYKANNQFTIGLDQFKSGLYFIEIQLNNKFLLGKFVVSKSGS